jgi:hypothetical protein
MSRQWSERHWRTVARCISEGLVGGERFAVDASLIHADANKQNSTPKDEWDPGTIDPATAPRAVRKYLAVLDDTAFGAASEVKPKFTSHSDPAAQWTGANKGPAFFAYATNYQIDTDNAVIVDVETTRAIRQAEVGAAPTMIDRTMGQFDLYPERLIADSAYGSAPMLDCLVEGRGIAPHIPAFDKPKRTDGTFSREDFDYDHRADAYICPAGKALRQRQKNYKTPPPLVDENDMMRYRASKAGLRCLPTEAKVLPEAACPQDPAIDLRRCPSDGPGHR